MGLFSNSKKLCPICGNPTPRLLATKIEGMPICKECDNKVDLPEGAVNQMSREDFRQYVAFHGENQALRDCFAESYRFSFGLLSSSLLLDASHGLLRLKDDQEALVLEASSLKAFRISEDNRPLFEGGSESLRCYQSDVPAQVNAMGPQIAQFMMQQREFERMEQMERMREQRDRNRDGGGAPPMYHPRPDFRVPTPFRHFYVELTFTHPYWNRFRGELDAPSFNQTYPSIDDYLRTYQENTDELHTLAVNLMQLLNPNAEEVAVGVAAPSASGAQSASAGNAIDEIQKYKTLLDAGVITEEEFTAKKRQLLGI